MSLDHKEFTLPVPDFSGDEGDPGWAGEEVVEGRWVRPPHVARHHYQTVVEDWTEAVAAYEANPDGFWESWHYLDLHPAFWEFDQTPQVDSWPPDHLHRLRHERGIARCVELDVVKVNPDTMEIDADPALNTMTRVWWETGKADLLPREEPGGAAYQAHWHDWEIDGAAVTVEEAVIRLARIIWERYGNDRQVVDSEAWEHGVDGDGDGDGDGEEV